VCGVALGLLGRAKGALMIIYVHESGAITINYGE
jgi:hypothetical protein